MVCLDHKPQNQTSSRVFSISNWLSVKILNNKEPRQRVSVSLDYKLMQKLSVSKALKNSQKSVSLSATKTLDSWITKQQTAKYSNLTQN